MRETSRLSERWKCSRLSPWTSATSHSGSCTRPCSRRRTAPSSGASRSTPSCVAAADRVAFARQRTAAGYPAAGAEGVAATPAAGAARGGGPPRRAAARGAAPARARDAGAGSGPHPARPRLGHGRHDPHDADRRRPPRAAPRGRAGQRDAPPRRPFFPFPPGVRCGRSPSGERPARPPAEPAHPPGGLRVPVVQPADRRRAGALAALARRRRPDHHAAGVQPARRAARPARRRHRRPGAPALRVPPAAAGRGHRRHYRRLDALTVLTAPGRARLRRAARGARTRSSGSRTRCRRSAAAPPRSTRKVVRRGRAADLAEGLRPADPAFATGRRRQPDWRLRIYGSGPERERLQAQIDRSGSAATSS